MEMPKPIEKKRSLPSATEDAQGPSDTEARTSIPRSTFDQAFDEVDETQARQMTKARRTAKITGLLSVLVNLSVIPTFYAMGNTASPALFTGILAMLTAGIVLLIPMWSNGLDAVRYTLYERELSEDAEPASLMERFGLKLFMIVVSLCSPIIFGAAYTGALFTVTVLFKSLQALGL